MTNFKEKRLSRLYAEDVVDSLAARIEARVQQNATTKVNTKRSVGRERYCFNYIWRPI